MGGRALLRLPATTSMQEVIAMRGGMDQITPTLSLKPGVCRDAKNFEVSISGGVSRIKGYERVDGRTNPSDAVFYTMTVTITGALAVGNTITGVTSAATGEILYLNDDGLLVYTRLTGAFQSGETLNVAASPQATISALTGSEDRDDFVVDMQALAADEYRNSIQAVPGTGVIRGVIYFGGKVYAFRDNAGGTALACYESSSSGWALVAFQNTISFTLGTSEYADGETLTQGGASAPILRVCLESGSWGAGTAAGRLIIGTVTGGPFAAGAAAGGGAATLSGAHAAITMAPGGTMEFDIGTVGAARRVFGIDGVNKAFEFDGDTIVPIVTGNASDVPTHVLVHQQHLLLSFGSSLQNSGIGTAFNWTSTAGAGEYLADNTITALKRMQGNETTGTAAVFSETGFQILYGSSASDFQLQTFEDSTGAKARTVQLLGQLYALDDRGVMALSASQNFGNFDAASITMQIRPFVQTRRNSATGSLVNREKSQYRIFFSDGSGLYLTIANGKFLGAMPVLFVDPVRCCCTGDSPNGTEVAYFGGDSGMVYRLDAGTSFDGDPIDFHFKLVESHQKSPRQNKRYRKVTAEVSGDTYCEFQVSGEFGYGTAEREQWNAPTDAEMVLTSLNWDEFIWDSFTWDGRSLSPTEIGIEGTGENISLTLAGRSAKFDTFTINSLIVAYSPRRLMR
jgi:hypothetical protein